MRIVASRVENRVVRDEYLQTIVSEVMGPGSEGSTRDPEFEIIREAPKSRYVTGILFPSQDTGSKQSSVEDDVEAQAQEGFDPESDPVVVDNSFKPSTMALSFYCNQIQSIQVLVTGATYKHVFNPALYIPEDLIPDFKERVLNQAGLSDVISLNESEETYCYAAGFKDNPAIFQERIIVFLNKNKADFESDPVFFLVHRLKDLNSVSSKTNKPQQSYQRVPFKATVNVDLSSNSDEQSIVTEDPETVLSLYTRIVRLKGSGILAPTVVLQNKSANPVFQCQIQIKSHNGLKFFASEDVSLPQVDRLQAEDAKLLFSYRKRKTYAFGHGVSATWEPVEGDPVVVKTSYVPTFDITPMSFVIEDVDHNILRPDSYLKETSVSRQLALLTSFVDKYDDWITQKTEEIPKDTSGIPLFKKFATENIKKCRYCSGRMRKAIKRLGDDKTLLTAFDMANEAILLQRQTESEIKVDCFTKRDYSSVQHGSVEFAWRPFQLAFILTTLCSVIDSEDVDRNKVDLIWVTTGGGKTEAYLFSIAVSILYQRLLDPETEGVGVIMRYTLRLLTAQQFERASALICALEYMRKNDSRLGKHNISIGLWVGSSTTPNRKSDAREALKKMSQNGGDNVFQLLRCPWCHKSNSLIPNKQDANIVNKWGYMDATRPHSKFDMKCMNPSCEFSQGIPVYVVDEAIYSARPTLLFGTVDKFAQVPLKEETDNLFRAYNSQNGKTYHPQLVLQDEMHLISGPLGSIVGLYEAGFDYILKQNGNRPKYLASTATIRNSDEQIRNLYHRRVIQFPPDGLEADNNFFVKPVLPGSSDYREGRRYIGVMGTGKSQVTTEVRLFGALLASIKDLDLSKVQEELYWTTVGYFNSIRELGKASTLIADDINDELKRIARRKGKSRRFLNNNVELTSRISSNKIIKTLDDLKISHSNSDKAVDTVIATNMLSVGIDISRLNVMVVVGQPKLTSEYIQATSRVGRSTLGSVFTLYNAMRSRDRSHYETFTGYHQSMYRFVEPSSVTPFSQPAMRKAIAAVIVMMMRHTVEQLRGDRSAGEIVNHVEELSSVKNFLLERVKDNDDHNLYSLKAKKIIEDFCNDWVEQAETIANESQDTFAYYLAKTPSKNMRYLLTNFERSLQGGKETVVMNSMRDIEATSNFKVEGGVGDAKIKEGLLPPT